MFFDNVKEAPKDAIFGLNEAYKKDSRQNKVYLAVGVYMDEQLQQPIMQAVEKAQKEVIQTENLANYLPVGGNAVFLKEYAKLVFGKSFHQYEDKIAGVQTVGGTSALRTGGDFLKQEVGDAIYFPDPTWPNHYPIFERAGFQVQHYPYYSFDLNQLSFEALTEKLIALDENSILLFHACCHNPTGCDLTSEEWQKLVPVLKEKKHLVFFDFAYMGFNQGVEKDRFPIELFLKEKLSFLVAASCSKSFSLYCQRVGALFVVCKDEDEKKRVHSQLKKIVRANYSNPPAHGAAIVAKILQDPVLKDSWEQELNAMRYRIEKMRKKFAEGLVEKAKQKDFSPIFKHRGMFSYCSLSIAQVKELIDKYGVYTLMQGRVNICGLNEANIDYVIDSMLKVADR